MYTYIKKKQSAFNDIKRKPGRCDDNNTIFAIFEILSISISNVSDLTGH
jgi:hypothetical protein